MQADKRKVWQTDRRGGREVAWAKYRKVRPAKPMIRSERSVSITDQHNHQQVADDRPALSAEPDRT